MIRFLLLFFSISILWFISYPSFAQDIIKKNDGEELKAKVVEVSDTIVKYKKFDDPEFFTYIILKKNIKSITFENGKTLNPNKKSKESFLALNTTAAMPFGAYGSSNNDKNSSGFAKPGFGSCLQFGFKFSRRLGLSFDLGSFQNSVNKDILNQEVNNSLGSGEKITTTYTNYQGKYILAGLQYYVAIGKRFIWINKISLGVMSLSKPEFHYSYKDTSVATSPNSYDYYSTSGNGLNGALSFGTSLRFKLSNRFSLTASMNVLLAKPKVYFNVHTYGYNNSGGNMTPDGEYSKTIPVRVMNAGIGMVFYLKRKK